MGIMRGTDAPFHSVPGVGSGNDSGRTIRECRHMEALEREIGMSRTTEKVFLGKFESHLT